MTLSLTCRDLDDMSNVKLFEKFFKTFPWKNFPVEMKDGCIGAIEDIHYRSKTRLERDPDSILGIMECVLCVRATFRRDYVMSAG